MKSLELKEKLEYIDVYIMKGIPLYNAVDGLKHVDNLVYMELLHHGFEMIGNISVLGNILGLNEIYICICHVQKLAIKTIH